MHEAVELRDGGGDVGRQGRPAGGRQRQRRDRRAAARARRIRPGGLDRTLIDLDGTPNKGRLGANAILGASLAAAKAAAAEAGEPLYLWLGGETAVTLPVPMLNVINGGAHATNSIDLQEFMVVPAGAETFADALRIGAEVYHSLKQVLAERGLAVGVGDEGGFAPDLESSEQAIEAVLDAADRAGHLDRIAIALDPATSEVYSDGVYRFEGREKSSAEMPAFWAEIVDRYPGRLDRGRRRRGRLGVVAGVDGAARRPRAARRRRPVRDEPGALAARASIAASATRSSSR